MDIDLMFRNWSPTFQYIKQFIQLGCTADQITGLHAEHQHKRNWKKKYYLDVNDLERAALAAKLKQQGINGGTNMKWLSMTKPHKERAIKLYSFRTFNFESKKIIDANGGAQLLMTTKQQIMASAQNTVFIAQAVEILERQEGKIDIYYRSNKANVKLEDYEYLPNAKRVYQKELPDAVAKLYTSDQRINNKIVQVLTLAMQYYGQILTQKIITNRWL
ncbi:MAG: hypothetical protein EZS28_022413 [Streblomastix strix]|uniref:Uncharacterized protein n=1 Tax=Streblomastix strix TaxID=222440 RepID=A0A5J4VI90_9EUKA|nr:MAG: hypothetical protein EZS28_022413 [Streblomastix strix]